MDQQGLNDSENPKRLSSIKSILNPAASSPDPDDTSDQSRQLRFSPGTTVVSAPSPGAYSNVSGQGSLWDSAASDVEKSKAERRAALAREAEQMRELLAAKERELAELDG